MLRSASVNTDEVILKVRESSLWEFTGGGCGGLKGEVASCHPQTTVLHPLQAPPPPGFSPEVEVLMSVFPAIFREETGSYLGNQFSLIGFCLKNVML